MIDFNRAHKILGIDANANRDQIKSAYNNLSKTYHPDKYKGNDINFANHQFSLINSAYKTMISPQYQNRNNNHRTTNMYSIESSNAKHLSRIISPVGTLC